MAARNEQMSERASERDDEDEHRPIEFGSLLDVLC